jgi:hypothetical protein
MVDVPVGQGISLQLPVSVQDATPDVVVPADEQFDGE